MDWNDVRLLLAVLRAKHLQDAGARLGMDASTVSRRIAALEKKLHARLFLRTREGLRPTAVAIRLRAHAERMEAEAAAFERAAHADTTQASGVVRVATTDALAQLLVGEGLLGPQVFGLVTTGDSEDLAFVKELVEAGKLVPVVAKVRSRERDLRGHG